MKRPGKKSIIIGVAALVLVLILIGGFLGLILLSFNDPITVVKDIRFASFDEDRRGFVLALTIEIASSNTFDLRILRITGDIYIDTTHMGTLENETGKVIPGHGSGEIVLSVHIKDEQMNVYTGKELKVQGMTLGKYLIYQRESPFEETKSLTPTGNQTQKFPPIAVIVGPRATMVMEDVQFSGADSYDKDGPITSFAWDLGDGATANTVEVTHRYTRMGVYRVSLTVTDSDSESSTAYHEIAVTVIP